MSQPNVKVPVSQSAPCVSVGQGGCNVSFVGPRVTVNNGAPSQLSNHHGRSATDAQAGPARGVTSTPLSSLPPGVVVTPRQPTVIEKVFLKAVSKDKAGKSPKMFTLRNINSAEIVSRDTLKDEIRTQLLGDITLSDFDVGFVSAGGSVVSIRNPVDLAEVWVDIRKGKKVVLWCDGL